MREVPSTIRTRSLLLPILALLFTASSAPAQDPQLTREDSTWARFPVGAWRIDKFVIYRENPQTGSMDQMETSQVTSRLVAINEDHYVLEVDRQITTDGRSFTPKTSIEKRCFDDTTYGPDVKHSSRERTVAVPGGKDAEVAAREFTSEYEDESKKLIVTSIYARLPNPRHAPDAPASHSQLIRRRTELHPKADNSQVTVVEWELIGEPQPVGEPQGTDWIYASKQRQANDHGFLEWTQAVSPFVPGGIVHSEAREYSDGGGFRQGVSTKLQEFGLEPKQNEMSESVDGEESQSTPDGIQEPTPMANQIASGPQGRNWRRRGLFMTRGRRRSQAMFAVDGRREGPERSLSYDALPANSSPEAIHDALHPCDMATELMYCEEFGRRRKGILAWLFAPKSPRCHLMTDCQVAGR